VVDFSTEILLKQLSPMEVKGSRNLVTNSILLVRMMTKKKRSDWMSSAHGLKSRLIRDVGEDSIYGTGYECNTSYQMAFQPLLDHLLT
jgi:hypothetical protein